MSGPAAEDLRRLLLDALRAQVGARAGAGRDDASLTAERLAALLEIDAPGRAALDRAAEERRRHDPYGEAEVRGEGARYRREWRLGEAHRVIGELVLAGELVADGPGAVALPGYGRATWRAFAELRAGVGGAARLWALAVSAGPAGDLGDAAPAFLRDPVADRRLAPAAEALHAVQALRQDVRDRALTTGHHLAVSLDRGGGPGAHALALERAELAAAARRLDAALDAGWHEGMRRAVRYARRP